MEEKRWKDWETKVLEELNHVSGEGAKNVDYSSGKAGNEQGERSWWESWRNGCLQPWALEKKLIEGSNKGPRVCILTTDKVPRLWRLGACEGFSFERSCQGRADFVWGGEESFRNAVKDIVFAVVNDHSPSEGKLRKGEGIEIK